MDEAAILQNSAGARDERAKGRWQGGDDGGGVLWEGFYRLREAVALVRQCGREVMRWTGGRGRRWVARWHWGCAPALMARLGGEAKMVEGVDGDDDDGDVASGR